jgi:two-component system, cell cycle response regulator
MRVLIAEDDLTSRIILDGVLKKWGYQTEVVVDGAIAWEALQRPDAPNLLVLDWNMPGMDGIEVCRRIREKSVSNPPYVILLTARGEKADIVKGLDAGANDYISKPYDNDELRARLRVGQRMLELQSELKHARDALAHEAMYDSLTGCLSRRAVLDVLKKELARAKRGSGKLSIGLCDIDHFKEVNDTYGHQVGDEVLREFACCIRDNLREYDHIGRYGGEEFLIVAPGSRGLKEEGLYERLCERTAGNTIITKAGPVAVTVSIGVAAEQDTDTVDDLLAAADAALYHAKNHGRNRVAFAERHPN